MTQEQFNDLSSNFYKLHDLIDEAKHFEGEEIEDLKEKFELLMKYYDFQEEIINKLRSINNDWVIKFDEEKKLKDDKENIKLPEIYILFRDFINNINSENYIECGKIRNKLLNDF